MRVCIPSLDPGGPDGVAAQSFDEAQVFDFYEVHRDGNFELVAQSKPCNCWGPDQAEAVFRRGIQAIIVGAITPNALLKFRLAGVKVLRADNPAVATLLDSFATGRLEEIGIDQFGKLRKMNERG